MKEQYEKESAEFKRKSYELEQINNQLQVEVEELRLSNNDYKNKNDSKVREIEKLKDELKKKEKANEDRFNQVNCNI